MDLAEARTHHANEAVALKELLGVKFAYERLGKAVPRSLELSEPDGPSTQGGKQARQALVLSSPDGSDNVIFGWVDVAERCAELRSCAVVDQQYPARPQRAVDIARADYDSLAEELSTFLGMQGISIEMKRVPPRRSPSVTAPPPQPVKPASASDTVFMAAVVGVLVGFGAAFIVFGLPNLL